MKTLSIKVFYVGAGDCIVLKLPDGAIGLVDSCVPPWCDATPALDYLRKQGGALSFMCLTHPHLDHYGGMLQLVNDNSIDIAEFWHPFHADLYEVVNYKSHVCQYGKSASISDMASYENRAAEFPRLMNWARDLPPGKERSMVAGRVMRRVENLYEIVALAPSELATSLYARRIRWAWEHRASVQPKYEDRVSAVLLIRFGDARIILGADAMRANWQEILRGPYFQPNADIAHCFKAAHHGSKYGFYHKMWPSLVRNGGDILVSAGSSRWASREFVESASREHTLWCTGRGPSCLSNRGPSAFRHLDDVSKEETGHPCFKDLEVRVFPTGRVEVVPERQRTRSELRCRM